MKNNVLILSVGRKVALVKAFKEAGWVVHGQDSNIESIGLKYCDTKREINAGWDTIPDLTIPTRDAELIEYAGMPGISPEETIDTCIDKLKFYHFCRQNNFLTPQVSFVKPRVSKSGKETECIWQEFVGGKEWSVDLYADFDSTVISAVPRLRLQTQSGESCVTRTERNDALIAESMHLATKLRIVGHAVLQCFETKAGFIWTDVNCRYGGASVVGLMAGCISPYWYLQEINGKKVEPQIGKYTVGLTGRSYSNWDFEYE